MIRKNNKGFAVTTLIYGLSIMGILIVSILMATIASERNNNTDLAKSIEQELKNVTNAEKNFQPVLDSGGLPAAQEYVVVDDGYYLIELWGCQGSGNGGYGAYTSGLIYLQKGETLYFYVGNHKTTGGEGGKATDVRILGGNYAFGDRSDTDSANTRIMTAAGGGSSSLSSGGTLYGYNSSMNPLGGTINTTTYQLDSTTLFGFNDYSRSSLSQSVVTSVVGSNGGGDGYYSSNNSEIGGTSYISGYGGVVTIMRNGTQATSSDATRYMYQELDYNENTGATTYNNVKPYVFLGGRMYGGVNEGDGKAKISRVSYTSSEDDLRQSSNFKNVTAVRDCVSTAGNGSSVQKVKFSVIAAGTDIGKDVAAGAIVNVAAGCAILNLSRSYDLEEIATWHLDNDNNYLDGMDFQGHTISVLTGGSWRDVKKSTTLSETETVAGNHVSAYQTGFDKLKSGVYYIMPVLTPGKVVTAPNMNDPLTVEYLSGVSNQKWSIELLSNNEYKIAELARFKSMSVIEDDNIEMNQLNASRTFNYSAKNRDEAQIWKITPVGDGTYTISTILQKPSDISYETGNILPYNNQLIIGRNEISTERFWLIPLVYLNSSNE